MIAIGGHIMPAKVVAVVTVAFWAPSDEGIRIALDALSRLTLKGVIVVHDRKGSSGKYAKTAVEAFSAQFETEGRALELFEVDEDDTTFRWKRGIFRAFEDPLVDAVFVFPSDFHEKPKAGAH